MKARVAPPRPGPHIAWQPPRPVPSTQVSLTTGPGTSRSTADFSQIPILPGGARDKALESYPGDEDIGSSPGDRLKRTTTEGALIGGGIGAVVGGPWVS